MTSDKRYQFTDTEATREQVKLRAGLGGITGSGKTFTGLRVGARIVERLKTGPLYVIDTEHKSALRYAFSPRTGEGFRFRHVPMPEDDNSPDAYLAALSYCEDKGAGVILIDSLSHMWAGIGGVLEQVDKTTDASRSKNAFSTGWKEWTPIHARAIERIMQSPAHVLFTLRLKTDWQVVENESGKKEPRKMGLAPVARDGIDYEPDFFLTLAPDGKRTLLSVDKSRALGTPLLARGATHTDPGNDFADMLISWLEDGEDPLALQVDVAVKATVDAETYKAARAGLIGWMTANRVPEAAGAAALESLKTKATEKITAAKPAA